MKVLYFFKIPFVLSSLWSEKNRDFCSDMLGNPEGRGRATPIFRAKGHIAKKVD